MFNLPMSPEEAQVLINLLNLAVKSGGLEVAEPAIVFTKRIQESARLANEQALASQAAAAEKAAEKKKPS